MDISGIFVILGLLAISLELILGVVSGFELFLIGTIFLISGGIGYVFTNSSIPLPLSGILVFLYLIIGRSMLKKRLHIATKPTNTDVLIGQSALVTEPISATHSGQVKISGETWRASGKSTHPQGSTVTIMRVEGSGVEVE